MSSTSTTWTTDTNTKSGTVQIYSSSVNVLRLIAGEGADAILDLFADQGDDNADKWRLWVNSSDDDLHFSNYTSGSWGDLLTIQDGGNVGIGTSSPASKLHVAGTTQVGTDGSGYDVVFYSGTAGDNLTWDASEEVLNITGTNGATALDVLDGDVRIVDTLYLYDRGGESISSDGTDLTIAAGTALNITADIIDLSDASKDITLNAAVDALNFGSNTLSIDASNNRVGIGTAGPDGTLHVFTATCGSQTADSSADDLTVENSADAGISILTPAASIGRLYFGDASNNSLGRIVYHGSNVSTEADRNNMVFHTVGSERVRIDEAGNVGIGTDAPGYALEVSGGSNEYIFIDGSANSGIMIGDGSASRWAIDNIVANDRLRILADDADVECISILQSGNVGIGTAAPAGKLDVADTGDEPEIIMTRQDDAILNTETIGNLSWRCVDADGATESDICAKISVLAAENFDTNNFGTDMAFYTSDNAGSALTKRMTILDDGNVGIGTATPGSVLTVAGGIKSEQAENDTANLASGNYQYLGLSSYWGIRQGSANQFHLDMYNSGSEVTPITCLQDGNVGIGATAPDTLLTLEGTSAEVALTIGCHSDTLGHAGTLNLRKKDATAGGEDYKVDDNDVLGIIGFQGWDDSRYLPGAQIIARMNGEGDNDIMPCNLEFWTNDGVISAEQRMIIDKDGNVGIGSTVPQDVLDVGDASGGTGITWGGTGGTGRYASIFTPYSAAGLVMATMVHGNTSSDAYVKSYSGSDYINAIRLEKGTDAGIQFYTDDNTSRDAGAAVTLTERMRINSSGNVGIGSTTPAYPLEIGGASSDTNVGLAIFNEGDTATSDGDGLGTIYFGARDEEAAGTNVVAAKIRAEAADTWNTSSDDNISASELQFWTNDNASGNSMAQAMVIDKDGYVGIGSTAPVGSHNQLLEVRGDATTPGASLVLSTADTDITDNDIVGSLLWQVPLEAGGTDAILPCAAIWAEAAGTFGAGSNQTELRFATANSETAFSDANTRMTIKYNGYVGIGTLDPGFKLNVTDARPGNYAFYLNNSGDDATTHCAKFVGGAHDGSGTTYYLRVDDGDGNETGVLKTVSGSFSLAEVSDIRLKKDIVDTSVKGLDSVNAMKVRDFKLKKSGCSVTAGFIANELKEVCPHVVDGEPDAMESYDAEYDSDGNITKEAGERIKSMTVSRELLVPVLVKAIQELSAEVEKLKNNN